MVNLARIRKIRPREERTWEVVLDPYVNRVLPVARWEAAGATCGHGRVGQPVSPGLWESPPTQAASAKRASVLDPVGSGDYAHSVEKMPDLRRSRASSCSCWS